ncbi:XTP/dITP diphosphatase [Cytobacillus spongiae]|jgi:XTP/dITP diphosphohydrolase|uniref:XTP/dITP diphosphatase n=1 Tax=Cytobacillus spongiae TaxID=2901381 RepID=UPI001F443D3E|nr:XTP/dITP diphosphatase [Cytobacillus spongiae]UII55089.1 XTP/dITP diphosphatase [Cytobacillus spongiae]
MKEMIIATKNKGKAKEFVRIFEPMGFQVKTLADFPELEDVEETGTSFEENATLKAETISKQLGKMVIADDSGLVVDALDGEPGIYSARYAGEVKNDEANMDKLLDKMKGMDHRSARFYCALAVASPAFHTFTVHGTCEGSILHERRGTNGFGYDPIFFVEAIGKAMAELMPDEKNQLSHRAKAIKKLEDQISAL